MDVREIVNQHMVSNIGNWNCVRKIESVNVLKWLSFPHIVRKRQENEYSVLTISKLQLSLMKMLMNTLSGIFSTVLTQEKRSPGKLNV